MPREPYRPPQHYDVGTTISSTPKMITFLHPSYLPDAQPLLILPACDGNDTIDHRTAWAACATVADNAFHGFISTDREGDRPVSDSQLPFMEDGYFFQVPGSTKEQPYLVCPSFRHWSPPQFSSLPSLWKDCEITNIRNNAGRSTSTIAHNVIKRDVTCRLTNYTERTEAAHIIPDGESDWFNSRGLSRRARIDDESNAILLKTDIHQLWDHRHLAIVPRKKMVNGEEVVKWFTYVLKRQPLREVIELYHDVEMQPLSGVDVLFLFCRFAWTIFESLDIFLHQGSQRWLKIRDSSTGIVEAVKCSAAQCRDMVFTRRGRSQSPKKKRTAADSSQKEERFEHMVESSSPSRSDHSYEFSSRESSEDGISRGRKRLRQEHSSFGSINSVSNLRKSVDSEYGVLQAI